MSTTTSTTGSSGQQQQQQVSRSTPMEPASRERKNKVLVLTATSHLGKAIVEELCSGPLADCFTVVAGLPLHEIQERRDVVKQLACEQIEVDLEDPHKLAKTIQEVGPKQIVLVGRSEARNVQHLRHVVDAVARFERPPHVLLISLAQADLKNNRWAQEFDEVEHHLSASEVPNFTVLR